MSIYEIEKRGGNDGKNLLLYADQHGRGARKAEIYQTGESNPGLLQEPEH